MRGALAVLAVSGLLTAGCKHDETPISAADVFTLTACPQDAGACQKVADGASRVTLEACVPEAVKTIAPSVNITLRASSGSWQNAPDKSQPSVYTASLSGNRCVRPTLVTSAAALAVDVDAEVAGYKASTTVELAAATLEAVELTAAPAFIMPGETNQILVHATVRASGLGVPTVGTVVSFEVSQDAGYAAMWPASAVIDDKGQAQSTLVIAPPTGSVTVTATATGPTEPGGLSGTPKPGTITITALKPDAGAPDGP